MMDKTLTIFDKVYKVKMDDINDISEGDEEEVRKSDTKFH